MENTIGENMVEMELFLFLLISLLLYSVIWKFFDWTKSALFFFFSSFFPHDYKVTMFCYHKRTYVFNTKKIKKYIC